MEARDGGAGVATMIKFCTFVGYSVGFLVALVEVRSILRGDKGAGLVLSSPPFWGFLLYKT